MKIAICDDDKQELLLIYQFVYELLNTRFTDNQTEILSFESSLTLINQLEKGKRFDIFLLDVVMPDMNGMELAAEIRSKDSVAKIIFLTSSPEFAVKSYSVGAFNYLLKPVQKNELFSVLEKACHDICYNLKEYILVKTQNELSKVYFNTLIYVEVIGRVIYFYKKDGNVVVCYTSISQVEEKLLTDKRFIKPHRSYIINMDYVKTLAKDGFTLISNQLIPVSRNAYKDVKQAFFEHLS